MNICYLYTAIYPYTLQITFLHTEVKILAKYFDKVIILPIHRSNILAELPENVEIKYLFEEIENHTHSVSKAEKMTFFLNRYFISDLFKSLKYFVKSRPLFRNYIGQYIQDRIRLKYVANYQDTISSEDHAVFYSYWFDNWATLLAFYRKKNKKFKYISRAHGFEIFAEQRQSGFFPFRDLQLSEIEKVYSVSRRGRETLKRSNPAYNQKIEHLNIGSIDEGFGPFINQEEFVLVSCARISSIKRVHRIAEMLKHIDFKIRWVHFGATYEGEDEAGKILNEQVELLKQKPNVVVEKMGNKTNEEIMEYYKTHSVNAFISLSSTEGIPVTMMEAISFGIPLISTDVGGCSEIATPETGVLVNKEESPEKIAEILNQFKDSEMNTPKFRNGVRAFWEKNFDIEKNIEIFLKEIQPVFEHKVQVGN